MWITAFAKPQTRRSICVPNAFDRLAYGRVENDRKRIFAEPFDRLYGNLYGVHRRYENAMTALKTAIRWNQ